jgi:hypothetical protein
LLKTNYEMTVTIHLACRVFESFTQTFHLILRTIISILRKLENEVENLPNS